MKYAWIGALLLLIMPAAAWSQQADTTDDTRLELESRRDSLTALLQQMDVGDDRAPDIERSVANLEQRLRFGDYRPGDVVGLSVRGQEDWTGNFPVQPDQTLVLNGLAPIPLAGVLRSEAEEVIRTALSAVLRNPVIELASQMRISVSGQVSNPGFYDVSGSLLLSDVIMLAGGPTQRAKLEEVEIRRLGEKVSSGSELTARGATLDDLGVMGGDVINVPTARESVGALRTATIIIGSIATVVFLVDRVGN